MSDEYGIEGLAEDDRSFSGSRFAEVRDAVFANPYSRPYEIFPVTLGSLLRGALPFGMPWLFASAARRTVQSYADLRWGPDGRGFRRLLHPSGVCLTGLWEITEETPYSGYFRKGSRALVIARYSVGSETRRGRLRSMAMVGRIYPTTDPEHPHKLPTANFFTQEDIGGDHHHSINETVLRNAPNTTITHRNFVGALLLLTTGAALTLADRQPTIRQLYEIAELGKPPDEPTRTPQFMQLIVDSQQPVIPGDELDIRDEVMAQVYETPQRSLTFHIETTDVGKTIGPGFYQRRKFEGWRRIGTMRLDAAVASYNGDRVVHFHHPPWRKDVNDPSTARVRAV